MVKISAADGAKKWAQNTVAANQYMIDGVKRVDTAPTVKAAAKLDKALQNYTAAIQSGKTAANLRAVSKEDWQAAMLNKGVPRVAQGVNEAIPKTEKVLGDLYSHIEKGQSMVEKMPDNTLEDSINRMAQMTRHMATFKKS